MTSLNILARATERGRLPAPISSIAIVVAWMCFIGSISAADNGCSALGEPDDEPLTIKFCIDHGRLMDLKIGDNKKQTVDVLTTLRATSVNVNKTPWIRVSRPEELYLLAKARGVTLVPGDIIVRFSGDRIEHVSGGPEHVWGKWLASLRSAKTRSEAFAVLADLLKSRKGSATLIDSDSSARVLLSPVSEEEWSRLESMNDWRTSFRHPTGFWYLHLLFDSSGRLIRILAVASAQELS